jgi:ABC-type dipeptide/oligopeptide/nickel transport system permease subunit
MMTAAVMFWLHVFSESASAWVAQNPAPRQIAGPGVGVGPATVGVRVAVFVADDVGVNVTVGVLVGVRVAVFVGVLEAVVVGVALAVFVGVDVAV